MTRDRRLLLAAWFLVLASVDIVVAQFVQGPYGPGGTWNVYEIASSPSTWHDAHHEARARQWNGVGGHLLDISSAEENRFVEYLVAANQLSSTWLGLTDREGATPLTLTGGLPAPQESSSLPDPRQQGWAWTTGQALTYTNWAAGEPRDFASAEDAVLLGLDGNWNDLGGGWAQENPAVAVLQPGTSRDETVPRLSPFLVEYQTGAAHPWPGITRPIIPLRMPERLPGVAGQAGTLGVTDYRNATSVPDHITLVSSLISQIADGQLVAEVTSGQIPRGDVTDPESRRQGGPIVQDPPFRFPSDQIGVNDDHLISIAHGTLIVQESGTYTIQVRSAAGFALQIDNLPFQSVSGAGRLDASEPSVMYFGTASNDTDSRGVIQLPAGLHELQFYSWSSTGQAYWEITSAKGAFVNDVDAQWLAIGDASELPAKTLRAPVQLTGPVQVVNAPSENLAVAGSLEDARQTIDQALQHGTALVRNDITTVVLRDEDGICCHRPGSNLDDSLVFLWPVNDPAHGGSDGAEDHFASEVTGSLTLDDGDDQPGETIRLTFGVYASDGVQLHVSGASFESASDNGSLRRNTDGDVMLAYDGETSNTSMRGLIQLTEGIDYGFDALHFENKGDAGLELWVALGDQLAAFDSDLFFPLSSTLSGRTLPPNRGFSLVARGSSLRGDFDGNNTLDVGDLELLLAAFDTAAVPLDLDSSGQVDRHDLTIWVHNLARTWIGDANMDGVFNSSDLVQVLAAGKYETEQSAGWSSGDWNGDRRFTTRDFVAAWQDGGYERGPVPPLSTVPEPASCGWQVLIVAAAWCSARCRATC
jgi:hypothetical protein